jgi:DNA polymerase III subunit delta'
MFQRRPRRFLATCFQSLPTICPEFGLLYTNVAGFNSIIGQRLPVRLLQTFRDRGAIPHALLFTGMAGTGKRTVAQTFAMALNCQAGSAPPAAVVESENQVRVDDTPCGDCRACRRIVSGNHPDVLSIEPQGGILRIEQIRRLISIVAMKPFDAGYRVAIIADAHTLNPEAANALLKILEEPPAGTILILTSPQQSNLLPTIVSRCRHIRFSPLPADKLSKLLIKQFEIGAESALTIAQLAGGSVAEARRLIQTPWRSQRDWLVRAAGLDAHQEPGTGSPAAALALSGALAAHKDSIQDDLAILKSWIRDLWIVPHAKQLTIYRDCEARLVRARARIGTERLRFIWETIDRAQKDIAANANLRLTLDVMALKMVGPT